jgi:predicted metal-dependent hydrolase
MLQMRRGEGGSNQNAAAPVMREDERAAAPAIQDDEPQTPEHPEQVLRFVARFDRGDYWLAHEELEDLWLEDRSDLYKGLIQVAAAFVHVDRNNWNGAAKMFASAGGLLDEYPDRQQGFDLERIRQCAGAALDHVEVLKRKASRRFDESLRFQMRPFFAGHVDESLVEEVELPYRVRRHEQDSER